MLDQVLDVKDVIISNLLKEPDVKKQRTGVKF